MGGFTARYDPGPLETNYPFSTLQLSFQRKRKKESMQLLVSLVTTHSTRAQKSALWGLLHICVCAAAEEGSAHSRHVEWVTAGLGSAGARTHRR